MGVLGAVIGFGYGCPVLKLDPEGAAAKAGIQLLDRLGEPGECPVSIHWSFLPTEEPQTVEWMVRRPKAATSGGSAASQDPDET
jgi:hypothetical protein